MDDISAISNINVPGATSRADAATLNKDFDDFLLLLTTQLRNQDPLSPLEATEFTNQLVAFSGVEQQIKTNEMLSNLLALNVLNITQIGLGFIGLDVERGGNSLLFDGETPLNIGYSLDSSVVKSTINIMDENGNTVLSIPGESGGGKHSYTWNGLSPDGSPLPAGKYRVSVAAFDAENKPVTVQTTVPSRIVGIESGDSGDVILITAGGEKVSITEVRKAMLPGA